jgi:hypothetical protein
MISTDVQVAELKAAGCTEIFQEKISGGQGRSQATGAGDRSKLFNDLHEL